MMSIHKVGVDALVPTLGQGFSKDGKVVIVERYYHPETFYYEVTMGPCSCKRARELGVRVMCIICTGPEKIKTLTHTSGDL